MNYSLRQAADQVGLSKATLHRAVKSGRLSAQRDAAGVYHIDASELARVYPETLQNSPLRQAETPREAAETVAVLHERVRSLEVQLADAHEAGRRERETARDSVADLRKRLDRAEERVLALTAERVGAAGGPSATVEASRPVPFGSPKTPGGFLARLFGRT